MWKWIWKFENERRPWNRKACVYLIDNKGAIVRIYSKATTQYLERSLGWGLFNIKRNLKTKGRSFRKTDHPHQGGKPGWHYHFSRYSFFRWVMLCSVFWWFQCSWRSVFSLARQMDKNLCNRHYRFHYLPMINTALTYFSFCRQVCRRILYLLDIYCQ